MKSADAAPPADDAAHLLVVDDDRRLRKLLARFLSENGYRVTAAESAADARAKLRGFAFDLIILDWMMPGESGLDLARALRDESDVPILMLTARAEADDRVAGLEAGVDDYLGKPFETRELLLRVASILRRAQPRALAPPEATSVRFGPFVYALDRGELRHGEETVRLTEREREMLTLLARAQGDSVPREALAGAGGGANERAVDVQVNRLRRKIERDPANPQHLQTARGSGYRLLIER